MHLDATNAPASAARDHFHLVPFAERARSEGSGDDRAEAADRETAIHRQAGKATGKPGWGGQSHAAKRVLQLREPFAGAAGDGNDGGILEK